VPNVRAQENVDDSGELGLLCSNNKYTEFVDIQASFLSFILKFQT